MLDMAKTDDERIIGLTRRHESTAVNTFALAANPPLFVRGEGPFLVTADDEAYVDLISGSAVTNLGHGLAAHRHAIERAMDLGIYHTGSRFAHVERGELYGDLARILPAALPRVHFVSVGTEAVETAIKAAQYHTRRPRIFAFEGGYHGRTVGSLSITHAESLHRIFSTLKDVVTFIPYPYRFRADPPERDEQRLAANCLNVLADRLAEARAADDLPSSIILEAIQGTSGAIRPPAGFLKDVRALATDYGVLLIVDEIWTGFGRTGAWFAFQHDDVVPDLICLSKGLTAGLPLAAVAGREDILGAWPAGIHTSTFQGNPIACAMARATLAEMHEHRWVAHAAGPVHDTFGRCLADLEALPHVRDVRWIGAAAAIEFMDADGRPSPSIRRAVQDRCFEAKVLVYGGGRHDNTVMLLPPINIDPEVLAAALGHLVGAIKALCR
jgi:4-aminobutyrate aminotransferase